VQHIRLRDEAFMTKKGGIKAHSSPIANHCADHLPEVGNRLVLIGEKLHQ
jgi:hypothetical protein